MTPTPQDAQLKLQDTVTKTATFTSGGISLGSGRSFSSPGQPMTGVVQVDALDLASGNESYKAKIQQSDDDVDGNYADAGAEVTITAAGVVLLPVTIAKQWVRLVVTLGGTTPSLTYTAWLNPLRLA